MRGLGVVGAQPLLKPGENFEYTSGTAIATPVGTMRGSYQMVAEDGTQFDAADSGIHAVGAARTALGGGGPRRVQSPGDRRARPSPFAAGSTRR